MTHALIFLIEATALLGAVEFLAWLDPGDSE